MKPTAAAGRTVVTFRSNKFNHTEVKDYFINDCCFGDDLANWIKEQLVARGVSVAGVGQEDFGWYVTFAVNDKAHHLMVGYSGDNCWIGFLIRQRSLFTAFLERKGSLAEAAHLIHLILSSSSDISNIAWHDQRDFDHARHNLGKPTPAG